MIWLNNDIYIIMLKEPRPTRCIFNV